MSGTWETVFTPPAAAQPQQGDGWETIAAPLYWNTKFGRARREGDRLVGDTFDVHQDDDPNAEPVYSEGPRQDLSGAEVLRAPTSDIDADLARRFEVNRAQAAGPNNFGRVAVDQAMATPASNERLAKTERSFNEMRPWYEAPTTPQALAELMTAIGGTITGSMADPTTIIGGAGKTLLGTFTRNAVVNAATDIPTQLSNIEGGIQQEYNPTQDAYVERPYDPVQTVVSALIGGAIPAGAEAIFNPEARRATVQAITDALRSRRAGASDQAAAAAPPTPQELADIVADPEIARVLQASGITADNPRVQEFASKVEGRRAAETTRPAQEDVSDASAAQIFAEMKRQRDLQEQAANGEVNPAFVPQRAPREAPPEQISVDSQGVARAGDNPELEAATALRNGRYNLPAVVQPQPEPMSDAAVAIARAQMRQPDIAETAPRYVAPTEGLPRTADQVQTGREAEGAFDLAQRQRERIKGAETRDTQAAGLPKGVEPRPVTLDEGNPVKVLKTETLADEKGRPLEVATVRRYDPRTDQFEADAPEYQVPTRRLKQSTYTPEPRRAQDFAQRAKGPVTPERPREPTADISREPKQTFRATKPDPNEDFPAAGDGRSPIPPQGPEPKRRYSSAEEAMRDYAAREEQTKARGQEQQQGQAREEPDTKSSNEAAPRNADGRFDTDDAGFVKSTKGGPIKFGDQKQAAKWILNVGQKQSADQFFQIHNHPSGKGYSVKEAGRTETPPPKPETETPKAETESPKEDAAEGAEETARASTEEPPPSNENAQPQSSTGERKSGLGRSPLDEEVTDRTEAAFKRQFEDEAPEPPKTNAKDWRESKTAREAPPPPNAEPKRAGGTKFSANPFLDPENIGPFIKRTAELLFGGREDWARHMAENARIRADVKAAPKSRMSAWESIPRYYAQSADGYVRSLAKRFKSATMQAVADHFHAPAGDTRGIAKTFDEAVANHAMTRMNELSEALAPWLKDPEALKQITRMVQAGTVSDASAMGRAALAVKKMLADELKYLREAGVDVGEVKQGYFPREYETMTVMRDPQGFVRDVSKAYRQYNGMDAATSKAAAEALLDTILMGGEGHILRAQGHTAHQAFTQGRTFPKQADDLLRPWLVQDPTHVLSAYFNRAARRAETARRFGDQWAKWPEIERKIREEVGAGDAELAVDAARSLAQSAAGLRPKTINAHMVTAASWARTWASLALLDHSLVASLQEAVMGGVRAGSLGQGLLNLGTVAHEVIRAISGSESKLMEMAEDLGIIYSHLGQSVNAQRFVGDVSSQRQEKVMRNFFRGIGLDQYTNITRAVTMGTAQSFIRRMAKDAGTEYGRLHLRELGIPKGEEANFAKWLKTFDDMLPDAGDLKNPNRSSAKEADWYRTALQRFVDQSIMRPSAATRPGWASHPLGGIAFQLNSFNMAFGKNVLLRQMRRMRQAVTDEDLSAVERAKLATAMLGPLVLLAGVGAAISEKRDELLGSKVEDQTPVERGVKIASRIGAFGGADPWVNFFVQAKYQKDPISAVTGPVIGGVVNVADIIRKAATKNSDKTNTVERKAAKQFYDIVLEPGINYLTHMNLPVSLISAGITQAAGSGHLREEFVSAVAGEKPRDRHQRHKR